MTDAPTGYHLMLPEGWRGFQVDDDGLAELRRLASDRCRALGRPDLEAQLRQLLAQQWSALKRQLAKQVFMPVGASERTLLPMTIAVRQLVATTAQSFDAALASATGIGLERIETPIGPVLRGERVQRGAGELAEVQALTVVYGFALPEPHERRGMVFTGGVTHPSDADPDLVRGHVELLDAIMETMRWR